MIRAVLNITELRAPKLEIATQSAKLDAPTTPKHALPNSYISEVSISITMTIVGEDLIASLDNTA